MERPPGRPQEAPGDPQEASKRLQSCPQEASTHRKPNQARRNARSDEIINIFYELSVILLIIPNY